GTGRASCGTPPSAHGARTGAGGRPGSTDPSASAAAGPEPAGRTAGAATRRDTAAPAAPRRPTGRPGPCQTSAVTSPETDSLRTTQPHTGCDRVVTCFPCEDPRHRLVDLPAGGRLRDRPQLLAVLVPGVHRAPHGVAHVAQQDVVALVDLAVDQAAPDRGGERPARIPDLPPAVRPPRDHRLL